MAKQLVESMFSNDNPVRFGSFVLEGSTVTYEVITNEDGTEFIRMTIVDQEGSSTVIEIPIGTGYFGDDGSGDGDGEVNEMGCITNLCIPNWMCINT